METLGKDFSQTLCDSDSAFEARWLAAEGIEGWFNRPSALTWNFLLCMQRFLRIEGNMVELGVWHGKSLIHSLAHCQPGEHHLAIDAEERPGLKATLGSLADNDRLVFRRSRSCADGLDALVPGPYRWIHVDAGHDHKSVWDDLTTWAPKLADAGILVLDDFFNFRWAEVSDALFKYLYASKHNLAPLCMGWNKAYFTTKAWHKTLYGDFMTSAFREYMSRHLDLEYYEQKMCGCPCLCFRQPLK